jgi:pSer/pThr/pTyr-binding forkhead associated (FHA) protein
MADVSLEIVEGPGAGRQVPLDRPVEIGREEGADVVLDDELVSRRHVRVTPEDTAVIVEDLGSLNGSFVNGEEIHARTRMSPGDQLLVGVTMFELRSAKQIAVHPTAVRPKPPGLATPVRAPDYVPPAVAKGALEDQPLDALFDKYTKGKARLAPLGIFVLVVFVVIVFLATR